jgi:hypothetical protein
VGRRELRTPVAVAAYTVQARATTEAIVGATGALNASRITALH